MPRIIEYTTGNYKVDSHVINKYTDDLNIDNNERVGIYRNHKVIVPNALFSDWLDPAGTPYNSLADLISDINTFFFISVGINALIPANQIVNTFADLPSAAARIDQVWYVRQQTGTWILGTRRQSGFYLSDGITWNPTNDPLQYFVDDQLSFKDDSNNTKQLGFQLDQISSGNRRIATWPDKNGTVAFTDDLQDFFNKSTDDASDITMASSSQSVQNKIVNIQNETDDNTQICTSSASFINTVVQNVGTGSNPAGTNIQINLTNILGPNNLSYGLSSGSVTIPVAGWYKVSFKGLTQTSTNNRQNTAFVVKRNLVNIVGTFAAGYNRNPANNDASSAISNVIPQFQFSLGDTIGLYAIVQGDGNQNAVTVAQECVLTLEYIGT